MAQLGSFIQSITDLSNIEWSKSWLWDIKFGPGADSILNPAPVSPFDKWIPAVDYNETRHISNTLVLPFYLSQYKFLQTRGPTDIQMTLHDDVNGTMYRYLGDWFSYVLDSSDGVCMLNDAYRTLYVNKLNTLKTVIQSQIYYVVPEGSLTETLSSSSDTKSYSLSLAVVGRLAPTYASGAKTPGID